jgi:hypothetical protein
MVKVSASRPAPNLEDQVSLFIAPGDRVAHLYPRTLGRSSTSGSPFPVPTYVDPWGHVNMQLKKRFWKYENNLELHY